MHSVGANVAFRVDVLAISECADDAGLLGMPACEADSCTVRASFALRAAAVRLRRHLPADRAALSKGKLPEAARRVLRSTWLQFLRISPKSNSHVSLGNLG